MSWFERLHPRDPRSGEFIDKGGWARGLADKIGGHFHYRPGKDQREKVLKDRKSKAKYKQTGYDPHRGDNGLAKIAGLHGWDAPAKTGSKEDLDAAVADGGLELWRGVHAGPRSPTAPQMLERERSGPVRYGYGIYGNGMYTSVDRRVAEQYGTTVRPAGFRSTNGRMGEAEVDQHSIQRMILSPHARVVRYLSPEWNAVTRDQDYAPMNQAMAAGVDVIYVQGGRHAGGDGTRHDADQYIILNRTAVLYEAP
jgi:hypothetical protein